MPSDRGFRIHSRICSSFITFWQSPFLMLTEERLRENKPPDSFLHELYTSSGCLISIHVYWCFNHIMIPVYFTTDTKQCRVTFPFNIIMVCAFATLQTGNAVKCLVSFFPAYRLISVMFAHDIVPFHAMSLNWYCFVHYRWHLGQVSFDTLAVWRTTRTIINVLLYQVAFPECSLVLITELLNSTAGAQSHFEISLLHDKIFLCR